MKSALIVLVALLGCHRQRQLVRLFELHPINRETAVGIWAENGGERPKLGLIESDGAQRWSIELDHNTDTSHARFVVDDSRVYLAHQLGDTWFVGAFDEKDGHSLWTTTLVDLKETTKPEMRLAEGSVVIWNSTSLLVVARDNGRVRISKKLETLAREPTITGPYVLVEQRNDTFSVSVSSGTTSRLDNPTQGCADGNEYLEWRGGKVMAHQLADLSAVLDVATLERPLVINTCGHYGTSRVLSGVVMKDGVRGSAVDVINEDGQSHAFDFPGDQGAEGIVDTAWHGRADLNGALTRFVPFAIRDGDGKKVDVVVLDLQMMTTKRASSTLEDLIVFSVGDHWVWAPGYGGTPVLTSLDGATGEVKSAQVVASKIPPMLPDDIAASTYWLYSGAWTTAPKFEITRFDMSLTALK
jgi:PQQ-like domain